MPMFTQLCVGLSEWQLDGIEFKQTAYALDRDSRKAALARWRRAAPLGRVDATARLPAWAPAPTGED